MTALVITLLACAAWDYMEWQRIVSGPIPHQLTFALGLAIACAALDVAVKVKRLSE